MIHVQVIIDKGKTIILQTELTPSTDARQSSIPSHIRFFGICRKPEITMIQHFKHIRAIENCSIFTLLLAVITTHTDVIKPRESFLHILQLIMLTFLRAKDVKSVVLNQLTNIITTRSPSVTIIGITLIVISNIIGSQYKLGRFFRFTPR